MGRLCALVLVLSFVIGLPVAVGTLGRWVLRPLDEAAKDLRHPTQFTIADFLCLFFLLQVSLAGVYGYWGPPSPEVIPMMWAMGIFAWITTGLFWAKCVQVMSRAGIHRPWHRAALLVFVWPVTLVAAVGLPALIVAVPTMLFDDRAWLALTLAFCCPGALGGLWLCAKLTRHVVAVARGEPDGSTPAEGTGSTDDRGRV